MDGLVSALLSHLFGLISLIGVCVEAQIWRLQGETTTGEQQRQRRTHQRTLDEQASFWTSLMRTALTTFEDLVLR